MRLIPGVYRHSQAIAMDTWTIKHNLGSNGTKGVPIVDVTVTDSGKVQKLIPAGVEIVDKDNLIIRFSAPRSGSATIIA
jgi:hypothetical protein